GRRAGRQRDRGCGGVSIVNSWKQSLAERCMVLSQRPSLQLLRLFAERMLHGGGELGADDLDLGMGVVLIFLAMPGVLVSLLLFPMAVMGSLGSFSMLLRCAFGHASSVSLSSAFSFLAIFALSGTLMACLPYRIFRKVSVYVRFALALCLLALLTTSITVSSVLSGGSQLIYLRLGGLP